ncbi:hypothetical protein EUGRSUZ_H04438 [Eucalyptus grandis]|uniref:Uncharacterized protein n=2 Tax=Eucalyptus grandis TaxID=71139 RepID=A0ACC3JXJ2_EUCGR|nr:hypothetical protein EUGRSUZ_H04438 [Eucalyptus grandis]
MEGAGSANQPLLSGASRLDEDEESGACHNGGSVAASVPSSSSSSSSSCSSGNSVVLFSSLVAVCGSYVFGNAVGYSSPAETGIMDDLGLSLAEYSVFGSTLTIGAMVGAVPSGRVADLLGRRGAMWLSELFCITGWLAILFAKGTWWLDAGRLLMGCGIGLLSYVVPVYVAEIAPKNVRGVYTSLNQLMIGLGKAFMFLIGSLVSWRVLALIGTLPCLLQLLGLFFIPESPRWLAKVGREKEFEAALQRLRGKNANISQEASDIKDYMEHLRRMSEDGITELLQAKYAYPLIVGVGLMIIQQCGGLNGFVFYTSVIFEAAGFSTTIGTVIAAVVQILSTTLGVLLIDKSGRRPLLLVSAAGGCLGCVFTGLSFFLQDLHSGAELVSSLVLVGVLVFLGSFELGMGGIPWIIMSEIFPINVKGSAGSFVNLVSWVGSWFVSYTFSYLFEWSSAGTFFIYAGICAVGVIFIAKLVPETKGRTLEEIHASITDKNDNNLS